MPAAPPTSYAGAGGNGTEEPGTRGTGNRVFAESYAKSKGEAKTAKTKTPITPSATNSTIIVIDAFFTAKKEGVLRVKVAGVEIGFVSTAAATTNQTAVPFTFLVPAGASWEWEGENTGVAEIEYTQYVAQNA